MADVELRFLGETDEAEHSVVDLRRCLEILDGVIASVQKSLGEIKIDPGTVTRFVAETAVMQKALEGVEEQAHDTRRAVAETYAFGPSGASSLLAAAVTGRAFTPDRYRYFVGGQGGAPGTDLLRYDPLNALLTNRVFGVPGQYAANRYSGDALNEGMRGFQAPYSAGALERALRGNADQTEALTAVMAAAVRGGGGGGEGVGGAGGILAALGMGMFGGRGGRRPPGWLGYLMPPIPFAHFGSPLALAGLGAERILGSTLGIGGSMAGGLLGGGLYASGLLGTAAVGMGTDMAGIGQAAGDIKTVNGALNNLNTAIMSYGKNSREAKQAQAQLNQTLEGFSPVARAAVLQAAHASQHFKQMFDYFTGPAERRGAQIITSGIQTGQAFLPTIGKFAFENMGIIQKSLTSKGGLFDWLKQPSGGLGIFTDLEKMFQQRLPTAMHAMTQGVEVFLHVIDDAAHHTGGFLTGIDKFFTKLNTPAGLKNLNSEVGNMIDLFTTWLHLFTALAGVIFDLFKPAVGLGKDFAVQLTRIVNLTKKWIEQPGTQNVLHQLFAAHRQQMDAIFQIIRALWPVLEATITAFAQVEIVVTKLTIGPLKALAGIIASITKHPLADKIIGWSLALGLVYKGLTPIVSTLGVLIRLWATSAAAATASAATTDTALASEGLAAEGATAKVGVLRGAIIALGGEGVLAKLAGLRLAFIGLLGPLVAAAAAIYAIDKGIAKLTGFDALKKAWGSAGFGADNTSSDTFVGKNPYPVGSGAWIAWEAGAEGKKPGWYRMGKGGKLVPSSPTQTGGTHVGGKGDKAYAQGHHHHRAGGGGGGGYGGGIVGTATWAMNQPGAGTSYQFGGTPGIGKGTHTDCSGFTQAVYAKNGIHIPRTSQAQYSAAPVHPSKQQLRPGDLVFFDYEGPHSHVGIYVGGDSYIGDQHTGSGIEEVSIDWGSYDGAARYSKGAGDGGGGPGGLKGYNPGGKGMAVGSTRFPPAAGSHQHHGPALATKAEIYSAITDAQSGIAQINHALHDSFAKLAGVSARFNPDNIMGAHPLAKAEHHFDPLLRAWKKSLRELEHELHEHGLTAKQEAEIRARIDRIKKHVTDAFDSIRRAAQTQFQAATTAWSAFTQAFDAQFSGSQTSAQSQLDAARSKLGQLAQAVAIDKAQSAVLGGKADPRMAQTVIDQMTTVLAKPGGKAQQYTQQEIDNWLSIWGEYYAAQGYTPKQMYAAFNKLLKSVGLPPIDNPFDTGGLPLPPDSRGTVPPDHHHGGGRGAGGQHHGGGRGRHPGRHHHQHRPHHRIQVHHSVARSLASSDSGGGGSSVFVQPHVEIHFEKGLEWLDKHVKVLVDGQLQNQGRKANHRARSGRH